MWRPATNEIGKVVFPKGMNVRPVHYAVRTTEGTLNNLISADPRWKIFPNGLSIVKDEEERKLKVDHSRQLSFYFDNLWDDENLRDKVASMIWSGFSGVSGWSGGSDRLS